MSCVLLLPDGNLMEKLKYSFLPDEEEQKDSNGGPSPIDGKANERVFFICFGGILGLSKTNTDTNLYGLT
jgi:hypothetical protein